MIRALLVAVLVLGACWASLGLLLFLCAALEDGFEEFEHDPDTCSGACEWADDMGPIVERLHFDAWASEMQEHLS